MSFPSHLYLQARPEMDTWGLINELSNGMQTKRAEILQGTEGETLPATIKFSDPNQAREITDIGAAFASDIVGTISKIFSASMDDFASEKMRNLSVDCAWYLKAMDYIERQMKTKRLVEYSEEELFHHICAIYALLSGEKPQSGHAFRKKVVSVGKEGVFPKERTKDTFKEIDKYLKKHATTEDYARYSENNSAIRKKVFQYFMRKDVTLTKEEESFFHYFVTLMPEPNKLENLMREFAKEFKGKMESNEDPYTVMAWVRHQIVQIHPFETGNGRVARLMMHWVALEKGEVPQLIDNQANYEKATKGCDVKVFAEYLRGLKGHHERIDPFIRDLLGFKRSQILFSYS